MEELWAVRMTFSVMSDDGSFLDIIKEIKGLCEPFARDRDFAGLAWNIKETLPGFHVGYLHILLLPREAMYYKLSGGRPFRVSLKEYLP